MSAGSWVSSDDRNPRKIRGILLASMSGCTALLDENALSASFAAAAVSLLYEVLASDGMDGRKGPK